MSRIFVRGDTHGDFQGLQMLRDKTKYTKDDYVIICGDFGFVWYSNEIKEHQLDQKGLTLLSRCECNFIIIGGNHENYNAIEWLYPVETFHGARARYIRPNIVWIERGEVFTLKDKKKLANLVGGTFALLGILLLVFGFIGFEKNETIMMVAVGIILLEVVFVNAKMVE